MLTRLVGGAILAAANSRAELSLNHAGLPPDALARIRGASRLKPEQLRAVLVQMDKLVRMGDLLPVLLAAAAVHAPLASKVATASPKLHAQLLQMALHAKTWVHQLGKLVLARVIASLGILEATARLHLTAMLLRTVRAV